MALTDAQWAAEVADIVAELIADTITEAQASARLRTATEDWPTRTLSNADLAARVSRFLARLNGLILTNGPPDVALGELNTFAYDTVNGALYGPKTAGGWGTPVSLVGPQGAAGPKGDTGATGGVGPKGDTGDTGPKGDAGDVGPQGDQGDIGPKGDTGDQGVQGDVGPKGDTGDVGPKGGTGDTGATGPKGDKGDRGDAFAVNAQGDLAGRAAYDSEAVGFSYLDVENGNLYFRIAAGGWSTPIPFGKGDKGDQGDEGPQGPAGAEGPKGDPGEPGPKGDQGDIGPEGPQGPAGSDGSDATVAFATTTEVRAGSASGKAIDPATLVEADGYIAVTANGAFTLDFNTGRKFKVTLTASSTMTITGLTKEISGVIRFQQDATGGRTLGLNAAIKKVGTYTLSTAANAVDRCGVEICNGVAELTALEKALG